MQNRPSKPAPRSPGKPAPARGPIESRAPSVRRAREHDAREEAGQHLLCGVARHVPRIGGVV
ncbi:hypothetical protein Y601_2777 [Burkholderia pseudomallei MSHR640]|nr:hypothetical protein Y601_2777 [Burkholderia pseudomallei MSHR640]